ncbi:MAG: NADH-quinone oxidoreductase subunit NuoH, partial [Verrucomicrobiae bacterium]|nr:NADH-quinone oxidoreductase subunit NuoH [Verrucomicrobiae bacterium]
LFVLVVATAPILMIFPGLMGLTTWVERKGLARIQNRLGPNRVGKFGILQFVADGLKMLTKEDIVPAEADRIVHFLAPVIIVIPALMGLGLLSFGNGMTPIPVDTGVILFFGIGSLSTLAIFMAGWASRNKFSVLGAMRSVAQMVSYELPLVMASVTAIMAAGTLSMNGLVQAQSGGFLNMAHWHVFTPWGFFGFILFFIAALAETNRSPFDIPEAESELVAGHLTEYSGFKYALFFLAEYIAAFAIFGVAVTLFLGGWNGPEIGGVKLGPSWAWFLLKMYVLVLLMIWARGTFPRLRVDQLMAFAWKFMLPLAFLNILVCGLYLWLASHGLWVAGWIVALGILWVSYRSLSESVFRSNTPRRVYRYA